MSRVPRILYDYVPPMNSMTDLSHLPRAAAPAASSLPQLPRQFSWRTAPGVTISAPVNQGNCGSCWAINSAQVHADRWAIATHAPDAPPLALSLVCRCAAAAASNDETCCNGGGIDEAVDYFVNSGAAIAPAPPCRGVVAPPFPAECNCVDAGDRILARRDTVQHLTGTIAEIERNIATIKHNLLRYGPVATAYYVFPDFLANKRGVFANGGVYIHDGSDAPPANPMRGHVVAIVGWGTTPAGLPYWEVRNSWGTQWGDGGYFKFAMSIKGRNAGVGMDHVVSMPNGGGVGGAVAWQVDTTLYHVPVVYNAPSAPPIAPSQIALIALIVLAILACFAVVMIPTLRRGRRRRRRHGDIEAEMVPMASARQSADAIERESEEE